MSPREEIVYVVDDDARVREALGELLASLGLRAETFAAAADYAAFAKPDLPACLILDVELPDINGLAFQKQLSHDIHPPFSSRGTATFRRRFARFRAVPSTF
jgi:FixJ family two-component response regulator